MCRVLAYIGPEVPLECLLLTPSNSLINQSLDPEHYPDLHLAGWGFGAWSETLLKPEDPFIYRRPMAAFYDDNVDRMIPSLQTSTMLAHVRAASYDAKAVLVDENCHPFSFDETPWILAQNGDMPNWMLLQRGLLQHCEDRYLKQMRGTTDTEFLYVLLLSLLEGDGDEDVRRAIEEMVRLIALAMEDLDLPALTKLKMALVSPNRIIGVNVGLGHHGETNPAGDWKKLRSPDRDRRLRPVDAPGADAHDDGSPRPAERHFVRLRGVRRGRGDGGHVRLRAPDGGRGRLVGCRVRRDRVPREEGRARHPKGRQAEGLDAAVNKAGFGGPCGGVGRRLVESERGTVDAPPLAGGARTVAEDVPQMASAPGTRGLSAWHEQLEVGVDQHGLSSCHVGEAWPPGSGVELVLRTEQLGIATCAPVDAVRTGERVRVRAAPGRLGARPPKHAVGLRSQARPPLSVRAYDRAVGSGAPLEHAVSLGRGP